MPAPGDSKVPWPVFLAGDWLQGSGERSSTLKFRFALLVRNQVHGFEPPLIELLREIAFLLAESSEIISSRTG